MQKIDLSNEDTQMLERFVQASSEAKIIRKVCDFYMRELESVRNIDRKGNMGLQTLAALNALETLETIFGVIFSDMVPRDQGVQPEKKMSPYR